MKKIFFVLALISSQFVFCQSGIRINKTEYFTVSASVDPMASLKEKGLDIVGEIEYIGFIYVKAGFESFSKLYGGYSEIHGAVGINLTAGYFEKIRMYSGLRLAKVNRGGGFRPIFGLEAGVDYKFTDHLFTGFRTTLDKRYDQEIFGWEPELKLSGFVRIGYRWD